MHHTHRHPFLFKIDDDDAFDDKMGGLCVVCIVCLSEFYINTSFYDAITGNRSQSLFHPCLKKGSMTVPLLPY